MHSHRTGIGVIIFLVILTFIVTGCSQGGKNDLPTEPPVQPDTIDHIRESAGMRALWSIWDIYIDPNDASVDIVPLRGVNFQCNIVKFLQPPIAPLHMLTIQIDPGLSDIPNGYIVLDMTITHPFPGTKLCGFDVMGIVMDSYPGHQFASDPEIIYSRPPESLVLNPDGYTRWWNQLEFTTYGKLFGYVHGELAKGDFTCEHTLNPFKYYSDDIGGQDVFDPDPAARGFFSSLDPGVNTRRFELQFQTPGGNPWWAFKYAISASYVAPKENAEPPYTASDFLKNANMPEAYKIDLIDNNSTAFYVDPDNLGGDLKMIMEVRDWQLDGFFWTVKLEIQAITIESPTLFPSTVDLDINFPELVGGKPTVVRFPFIIEDVTPTGLDDQLILVTVVSKNTTTYKPQIPDISGFDFPDGPLAAYNIFEVPISSIPDDNLDPVADASKSKPLSGYAPLGVILDPSASYDPDGVIVNYRWDYENDGVFDKTTTSPNPFNHSFSEGTHYVQLEVRDDEGETDMLDEPLVITVTQLTGEIVDDGILESNHGLAVDSSGNPHIFYKKSPDDTLGYAWFDGDTWQYLSADIDILYAEGLDLDSNDEPHIIFSADYSGTVYYGHYNGSSWDIQTVYTSWPGTYNSIRIDSDDHPHFAIRGDDDEGIWHKWHDGTNWLEEHYLSGYKMDPSIDLNSNNYTHISHNDIYWPLNLYHSHFNGISLCHPVVTSPAIHSHLRIDSEDNVHIAAEFGTGYLSSDRLGHCFYDGTSWTLTIVDTKSASGIPSIAIDSSNVPHISYARSHFLKHAWFDGDDWHIDNIIDSEYVPGRSSIGIRPNDKPVIAYNDNTNDKVMCVWLD